ncbi:MAG: MarR family transcriptional regulator [Anaerolineales bacterium]
MAPYQMEALTQELFQVLGQLRRLKWEQPPIPSMKSSECELLGFLYLNLGAGPNTIAASELSNQLYVTPAAITHLLNPLEDAGFITREKDPDDRRFVLISLTDEGKETAKSLVMGVEEILEGLVNYLGDEESNKLIQLISKMLDYFSIHPLKHNSLK